MRRVSRAVSESFFDLVGNTPLVRLRSASKLTGCNIYGKCEFLNPGSSVKDRAASSILIDAEAKGLIKNGVILEGTAGNTGIGLTLAANARGYRTIIVMPSNQTEEKKAMLRHSGATLVEVPAVPYRNPNNFVRLAGRLAQKLDVFWAQQMDNTANRQAHIDHTGPEIWGSLEGKVDAFSCAMGTGGTLAGVATFLRSVKPDITIGLTDPQGAMLHRFFTNGELEAVGTSISEGVGQARVTGNMVGFKPDISLEVADKDAMETLYSLLLTEGLSLGLSSGINVFGAMEVAKRLGPGHTVVTILCDYAQRYECKMFDAEFLKMQDLPTPDFLAGSAPAPELLGALEEVTASAEDVSAALEAYPSVIPLLTRGETLP